MLCDCERCANRRSGSAERDAEELERKRSPRIFRAGSLFHGHLADRRTEGERPGPVGGRSQGEQQPIGRRARDQPVAGSVEDDVPVRPPGARAGEPMRSSKTTKRPVPRIHALASFESGRSTTVTAGSTSVAGPPTLVRRAASSAVSVPRASTSSIVPPRSWIDSASAIARERCPRPSPGPAVATIRIAGCRLRASRVCRPVCRGAASPFTGRGVGARPSRPRGPRMRDRR